MIGRSVLTFVLLSTFLSQQYAWKLLSKKFLSNALVSVGIATTTTLTPAHADSIAVFGGTGFVGSSVVKTLALHGDKVTSISPSGEIPTTFAGLLLFVYPIQYSSYS